MTLKSLPRRMMLISASLLLLTSCDQNIKDRSFCLIYKPIYTVPEDTEETQKQVDKNNLSFECLCDKDLDICKEAGF